MTLSAAEQYLLELINRARLDPNFEAARQGIDLNQGLSAGTISASAKQVLAPNALLEAAATKHSLWMLSTGTFSHTGQNGSWPSDRIAAEGYAYSTWSENIAMRYSSGTLTVENSIDALHNMLFQSAGHRLNILNDAFREIGLGAEAGPYKGGGKGYTSVYLTEVFGTSGSAHFLTGVAYNDTNGNKFYTMGEGVANVSFAAEGLTTQTAAAGGYALGLSAGTQVAVSGLAGSLTFSFKVDMSPGNVKVDLVSGNTFHVSGNVWLGTGVHNLLQLGVGNLSAWGNGMANAMTGNSGANKLFGYAGNDTLTGNAGADSLYGGAGNDLILGGSGNDLMRGALGADVFVFGPGGGLDRVGDFLLADLDRLRLDDALWAGQSLTAAQVVSQFARVAGTDVLFDFGADEIRLVGLTSLTGLSGTIDIV